MKKNKIEKVDRISELPEPILHHILSFLPRNQVARTCILSKRFETVWHTYPVLELIGGSYRQQQGDGIYEEPVRTKRSLNCFERFLRNREWKSEIKKFTIKEDLHEDPEMVLLADRCVGYAIESNVKELELRFALWFVDNKQYRLPQVVLLAKSIEVLKLSGCSLELPRGNNILLHSLRTLCLSQVDVELIEDLVSKCPSIQDLRLSMCWFESLKLTGFSKLNKLELEDIKGLERLDIKALNVEFLSIVWSTIWLAPREISSLAFCENLKSIYFKRVPITDDEWLCNQISNLPHLECLSIHYSQTLKKIKISSPSLKTLSLVECRKLIKLEIDTPNLRFLHYRGTIITLCVNALALLKVDLDLPEFHWISEGLKSQSPIYEDVIFLRYMRRRQSSPLLSTEHLTLTFYRKHFDVAEVVDGLLWMAPHTKKISMECASTMKYLLKFKYKKQLIYKGEVGSCCKCIPLSCWEHCIEEIEFEIRHVNDIKTYILSGADIMEKIDALCKDNGLQEYSSI
ncbi:hypothetical protein ACOSP7_020251 [Xanthoceras sorbifolium]